jgi:hypothetical protein
MPFGGKIKDGQATVSERDASSFVNPDAGVIGASVDEPLCHG